MVPFAQVGRGGCEIPVSFPCAARLQSDPSAGVRTRTPILSTAWAAGQSPTGMALAQAPCRGRADVG